MEMRLRIAINDNIWTEGERADISERATELYLSKSRKRKLDDENDTSKKPRLEKEDEDEETSDEEESDDDYTFFEWYDNRFYSFVHIKDCKKLDLNGFWV